MFVSSPAIKPITPSIGALLCALCASVTLRYALLFFRQLCSQQFRLLPHLTQSSLTAISFPRRPPLFPFPSDHVIQFSFSKNSTTNGTPFRAARNSFTDATIPSCAVLSVTP